MIEFDLKDISGTLSDCSTFYEVVFEKGATVKDLLNYVLSNPQWGTLRVVDEIKFFCKTIASCDFDRGVLKGGEIPQEILNKKIKRAVCNGGWGNMSYEVEVEE